MASRKTPIVLVHGGYHAGWFWDIWAAELRKLGWNCIAIDLPGRGSNPMPAAEFARCGVLDMVGYVTGVAARYDHRCVIVGHSLGGLIGQIYAGRHAAAGLILVAPAPPNSMGRRPGNPVDESVPVPAPSLTEMRRLFLHRRIHASIGDDAALHARLVPEAAAAINDRHVYRVESLPAKTKTLVLGAEYDWRHADGELDRETAAFHRGDFVMIKGFAHDMCVEEGTESLVPLVDSWLCAFVG